MTSKKRAPAPGLSAPAADLVSRFMAAADGAHGRRLDKGALFETLKLETQDWRVDQGLEAERPDFDFTDEGAPTE